MIGAKKNMACPKAPAALVPLADVRVFNQEMSRPYVAHDGFLVHTPLVVYRSQRNCPRLLNPETDKVVHLLHPTTTMVYGGTHIPGTHRCICTVMN